MKFWNSQKLAHVDKLFILAGKYNSSMDVLQKVFESLGQGTTTCIFSLFFIMGEAKLFPFKGHMITRHEVLAALLATEVREFIWKNLHTSSLVVNRRI